MLRLVGDVRREQLGQLGTRRLLVVRLQQAGAGADHLAKRPERDPLAIGRRPAGVPVDVLDQAVEVAPELAGEARLADARRPDHRDEPDT